MVSRKPNNNMLTTLIGVLSILTVAVHGQWRDYDDSYENYGLDGLGSRISASVQAQVAPLRGLGERINSKVNTQLNDLNGLGDRISQQVHQQLEPVRAIELNFKMRDGVGGVTIVTHSPEGRQFIIKNYASYTCKSKIDLNTGRCSGDLEPFKITNSSPKSDWCYVNSYSLVNNQVCLSIGSVSVQVVNGQMRCEGNLNSPVILMSLDEYKQVCSNVRQSTEYRYIPNVADPGHVAIPNVNKYVRCENQQENLCIFHENNGILSSGAYGGGVVINVGSHQSSF